MMKKATNRHFGGSTNALRFTFVFILLPILAFTQAEQKQLSLAERVQNLKLDSTEIGELAYYSEGYLDRAELISMEIERARKFYLDSLGIEVEVKIALLDTNDYNTLSLRIPYGLPFVNNGLIFLPADTSTGAVKDMYAPFSGSISEEAKSILNSLAMDYAAALNRMVDLIGLHEIGHVQNDAMGINGRQKWFDEFMASYFGYAYMQNNDTSLAGIWDVFTHAGFEGYTPTHVSLDVFNKLYFGVGFENYGWFQNAFQERIREVYAAKGLNFIRLVKEKLSDSSFQPATAQELLEKLEEIEPGFIKWADSLGN